MPAEEKTQGPSVAAAAAAAADDGGTAVGDAEVQRLLQSGAWKALRQEGTGRTYYYHAETRKTCWDLKKELLRQRRATAAETATAAATAQVRGPTASDKNEQGRQTGMSGAGRAEAEPGAGVAVETRHMTLTAPATPHTGDAAANSDSKGSSGPKGDDEYPTPLPPGEKGGEPMRVEKYRDPLQRLMDETNALERLMVSSGTSQAMALEFQRSYEALARTNKALTTQMVKMKQEYGAMEMALREANIKVYEKDLALRALQSRTRAVDKEDEEARTLLFLREQNRELVRQVGELTVVLSRGFNELAYQQALTSDPGALNPEQLASTSLQLHQKESLGTTLDRVLTNSVTQSLLCSACTEEFEKLRVSLLPDEEKAVTSPAAGRQLSTAGAGGEHCHHAQYVPAVSAAPAFNYLGHPEEATQAGMDGGSAGGNSSHLQPPPLPLQQRRGQHGAQAAAGAQQLSFPSPQTSAAPYLHPGGAVGPQSYPRQPQQPPPGHAHGRTLWAAQTDDGRSDTYADYFPKVSMNRRSESRNSVLSATPVFGGFRIRPSY
ncbi:uncharacterized protein Tco025E_01641 [Trypanosoma conorhini]|uniref:WW domain-containing protein n=1 Tax=Trypanosoma conorhini TaxID=83891 RepID=A0A3R7LF91_9TRYP|nr:uncharacterized protein Tco025E_01641 [Trypanosoma conorhini]RNF26112.1 hypothetical protein Tco025E_01641 [Trypanosoma conorhini]